MTPQEIAALVVRLSNKCLCLTFHQVETCKERDAERLCVICQAAQGIEALQAERDAAEQRAREALDEALTLAKVATNTWACVARSKRDHDVIGGLHRDIDAMRDKWSLGGQPPTGGQ